MKHCVLCMRSMDRVERSPHAVGTVWMWHRDMVNMTKPLVQALNNAWKAQAHSRREREMKLRCTRSSLPSIPATQQEEPATSTVTHQPSAMGTRDAVSIMINVPSIGPDDDPALLGSGQPLWRPCVALVHVGDGRILTDLLLHCGFFICGRHG